MSYEEISAFHVCQQIKGIDSNIAFTPKVERLKSGVGNSSVISSSINRG